MCYPPSYALEAGHIHHVLILRWRRHFRSRGAPYFNPFAWIDELAILRLQNLWQRKSYRIHSNAFRFHTSWVALCIGVHYSRSFSFVGEQLSYEALVYLSVSGSIHSNEFYPAHHTLFSWPLTMMTDRSLLVRLWRLVHRPRRPSVEHWLWNVVKQVAISLGIYDSPLWLPSCYYSDQWLPLIVSLILCSLKLVPLPFPHAIHYIPLRRSWHMRSS